MIFSSLKQIFSHPRQIIIFFLFVTIFWGLWYYFTDFTLIKGNYGNSRLIIDSILSWINILGFSLFIAGWIYRTYSLAGNPTAKTGFFGFLGGCISVIISGSICCGSSLLLPLGASFFVDFLSNSNIFPYGWLELKLLWVILLLIGLYRLLKNLTTCQLKKKH